MALPINIKDLLHGNTVEWERIECKQGWNPESISHTICAFANDINNWGGGYIIVGVGENGGEIQLPPKGITRREIDTIQKELLDLSHKMHPYYIPIAEPYVVSGKHILVIWVPGGDNRPYEVPSTFGAKGLNKCYVRRGSSSVAANSEEKTLLYEMAKRIPFDDRVHHAAEIKNLKLPLIKDFLQEIQSDILKDNGKITLVGITGQMKIVSGPKEKLQPINVGLLFFSDEPHLFFPYFQTDVIIHRDDTGNTFSEKVFKGPVHLQMRKVLEFIQTNIIAEKVIKSSERAESRRVFNYPFAALEEIVANAFYHRSYELGNPIEINSYPDHIEVISYPGPLPPVNQDVLKQRKVIARYYRNRRVGDFLKELKLTEGRATGFPTIFDSMKINGSGKPTFETDEGHSYFLAILPIHPAFAAKQIETSELSLQILMFCMRPQKRVDVLGKLGFSNHPNNYKRYILPLLDLGWLGLLYPDKLTSPLQRYVTTDIGKGILG